MITPDDVLTPDLAELIEILNRLPSLEELRDNKVEYLGRTSGVYFLWKDDELRYVGKSSHVQSRLASHVSGCSCKDWNHVAIIECEEVLLSVVEEFYIRRLNPPDNKTLKET